MGANMFKESKPLSKQQVKTTIPMEQGHIELLTHTDCNAEFNKMYLNSREKLHGITDNPSEEMLKNITYYVKQNSKFLTECFNEANSYHYDIVDMVTERLTSCHDADNNIPTADTKHVDSFLSSNSNYDYEKQ